ncbi:hypothetical protein SEA_JAMZY_61 [Gordonia phage Jamzy]|nr:hypothetical protein SEA_JAMZY_61 [Gordonia phage Jamzy]
MNDDHPIGCTCGAGVTTGMPPETDLLCIALGIVAQESDSPALVRTALIALYETEIGRTYLQKFPLNVAARYDIAGAHVIDREAFHEELKRREERRGFDYRGEY